MTMEFKDFEEKTLSTKKIYDGKIIKVNVDTVALPNGKGTASRELVFHPGGVTVLAITPEDKMVLVKQFRKPLEKVILEIPAGKLEVGESAVPASAARRELEEETGYQAGVFEKIGEYYLSVGFCDELLRFYYATDLTLAETPLAQDEDEVIERFELTLEEAKQAMADGVICDAKTIMAIQLWELQKLRGGHR
jgi:ADP-ribose pyrophosphatase